MNAKVVTLGGGTGHYMTLCACKLIAGVDVTAIVSMADSGGSSGRLRDKYGALPPGDVLQCLLALSGLPGDSARTLLRHRFAGGSLEGDNAGNWLLTVLHQTTGSFLEAIAYLEQILQISPECHVLPVTVGSITLHGRSLDGAEIHGEAQFDELRGMLGDHDRIREVWLKPNALMLGAAAEAIRRADYIILCPGDLFSSVVPVLLVGGVVAAIAESRARIIAVCNLVTTKGQTDGFTVPELVDTLEQYLKNRIDCVLYNTGVLDEQRAEQYAQEDRAYPIPAGDLARLEGRTLRGGDYLSEPPLVRHSPRKLAGVIAHLIGRSVEG
ncbi:uridine diphosphate-N-acetylglucosamine-binding protein YvcK [Candidatus Uhrbacteria bacterium]|nr:uridine diphosphate-N-acetylglucosamine-binding protein YvcK [Candidatus Uhrbacteria bacterium]